MKSRRRRGAKETRRERGWFNELKYPDAVVVIAYWGGVRMPRSWRR